MRGFLMILMPILCVGCKTMETQPNSPSASQDPIIAPPPPVKAPSPRQSLIEKLISQGEKALMANRLTVPMEDNAYDRFTAVLMLEPSNETAQAGLQEIASVMAARVSESTSRGKWSLADMALSEFSIYFPSHSLVSKLQAELNVARRQAKQVQQRRDVSENVIETISLDKALLNERSDSIQNTLKQIAQRLSESNESVLIYARNDAEGRWIYRIMKEEVAGYRIRGDIRISRNPSLKLMRPFES